jgi:hypothetical protein
MRDMILDMVDELLDSEGDIEIAGLTFARSVIVRKMDPIAYSMMVDDVVENELADLRYDMERLDAEDDADEIADIQEKIEQLEDVSY